MTEKEMNILIEKSCKLYDGDPVIKKVEYVMDFGELRVEYEFYSN